MFKIDFYNFRHGNEPKTFAVVHPTRSMTSRQKVGLPPEISDGVDRRSTLPWPCVVTIEEEKGDATGAFLLRWAIDGAFAGDTWHMTVEDAKHQATCEYDDLLDEWQEIPPNLEDVWTYLIDTAKSDI